MPSNKKTIRLVVFNEIFWEKGLIYSQHILPLKKLRESNPNVSIELIAFVSFFNLILSRKEINLFCHSQLAQGFTVQVFPILYLPSRLFYPRWFMIPFLFLNTLPYVLWLKFYDRYLNNIDVWYQLRSYEISMVFNLIYRGKRNLVFDPRSDLLEELVESGIWSRKSFSYRLWLRIEKGLLVRTRRALFISDVMKNELLGRHGITDDPQKFIVLYNQVDFEHFHSQNTKKEHNFLYTGSLGNWNNIYNYLKFFKAISPYMPDSMFYIVTTTKPSKYEKVFLDTEFDEIRKNILLYHNIDYEDLPNIYAKCMYGLQLMSCGDSRLGVKFVEYIAAGLLPIVNENVKGAADFVRKFSIGVVINQDIEKIDEQSCDKILNAYENQLPASSIIRCVLDLNQCSTLLERIFK